MVSQAKDMFEWYTSSSKYWMDIYSAWAKWGGSLPQAFGVDVETWFRPFWSYIDWTRQYAGIAGQGRAMPFPYSFVQDMSEFTAKSLKSYLGIYNTWLRNMDSVARESFDVSAKMSSGERADTDRLFDKLRSFYNEVTTKTIESLKETPFEGMKDLDRAVKDAIDSIPEEQKRAKDFFRDLSNYNAKMVNLSSSILMQNAETFRSLLENGMIPREGYNALADNYNDFLKYTIETLRLSPEIEAGSKRASDNITQWTKASADFYFTWVETYLKLYQGFARSISDIYRISSESFQAGKITSADDMYRTWMDATRKAVQSFAGNAQFPENTRRIAGTYSEWLKSSEKLYNGVMEPPFTTREDLRQISEELRKQTMAMEKRMVDELAKARRSIEHKMFEELQKVKSSAAAGGQSESR